MKKLAGILMLAALAAGEAATTTPPRYLFAFGGGGDPPGKTTIFDDAFKTLGRKARQDGWQSTVLFGKPDNGNSVEAVSKAFGIPAAQVPPFNGQTYDAEIATLENRIRSGDIKAGSTVVLWIDSHGNFPDGANKSHSVICGGKCSVDKMGDVVDLLKARDIRVALVDLSCHSGATIALQRDGVCVISATHRDTVALTSFADAFSENLARGDNFEEAFLRSRDIRNPYNPEITTPAGREVQRILDEAIAGISDETIKSQPDNVCVSDEPIDPLFVALKKEVSTLGESIQDADWTPLQKALSLYREALKTARRMKATFSPDNQKEFVIDGDRVQWIALHYANEDTLAAKINERARCDRNGRNERCDSNYDTEIATVRKQLAFREKTLKADPAFATYDKEFSDFDTYTKAGDALGGFAQMNRDGSFHENYGPLAQAAFGVLQAEHVIYKKLYSDLSTALKDQPNPCRDLKL